MKYTPTSLLTSPLIFLSTLITISSSTWITMWMFLEINMFSFLPLLVGASSVESGEIMVKYFLVQTLGSSLMLFSVCISMNYSHLILKTLFLFGVLMKMGAAPSHQWMLSIIKSLPLYSFSLILTWQKIAPLFIMYSHTSNLQILLFLSTLNALTGAFGALTQTLLRPLLVFSSLNHMGWMFLSMSQSLTLLMIYTFSYFTMFILAIMALEPTTINDNWATTVSPVTAPSGILPLLSLNLLSLAGMPPLLGFAVKLLVLWLNPHHITITSIILASSAIGLLYYISLALILFSRPQSLYAPFLPKSVYACVYIHTLSPLLIILMF